MAPLESQPLEESEPILGDGRISIARETTAKPLQGEESESTDLLKHPPAPDSSQQPKHNSIFRVAAQEQKDKAAGASPLPHTKRPLPVCIMEDDHKAKKPHLLLILPHPGDSKGKWNYAACFEAQVAVISSSYISLSRALHSPFESKLFIIRMTKQPDCQTGVNLIFSHSVYQRG